MRNKDLPSKYLTIQGLGDSRNAEYNYCLLLDKILSPKNHKKAELE